MSRMALLTAIEDASETLSSPRLTSCLTRWQEAHHSLRDLGDADELIHRCRCPLEVGQAGPGGCRSAPVRFWSASGPFTERHTQETTAPATETFPRIFSHRLPAPLNSARFREHKRSGFGPLLVRPDEEACRHGFVPCQNTGIEGSSVEAEAARHGQTRRHAEPSRSPGPRLRTSGCSHAKASGPPDPRAPQEEERSKRDRGHRGNGVHCRYPWRKPGRGRGVGSATRPRSACRAAGAEIGHAGRSASGSGRRHDSRINERAA